MDKETVTAIAKATETTSQTAGKLIDATTKLARVLKGPIAETVGILEDRQVRTLGKASRFVR